MSFSVVAASCGDALFEVKANIFLSIANEVAHFINRYQTDMPMLPFLATDMFQLVFNLLERFVKEEALAEVTSTAKLVQLDLTKSSLHKNYLYYLFATPTYSIQTRQKHRQLFRQEFISNL